MSVEEKYGALDADLFDSVGAELGGETDAPDCSDANADADAQTSEQRPRADHGVQSLMFLDVSFEILALAFEGVDLSAFASLGETAFEGKIFAFDFFLVAETAGFALLVSCLG